ncbi:serine/threonine protein kinase [Pelagicoccus mobilis]|uniref:Serine/threonine protein kinase n=1 Tax=Pelagicoccus mobilis TaxID=415221 RepID=A0A934S269_9BACT|nr:serine/threonine-protein kinase [Pelagicoccus mobilis]MBK1877713.1 serine/threonine protein kinase [Pelagicoccus mobilis]
MSEGADGYVPDKRLTRFVTEVESEDVEAKEDLCPSFMELVHRGDRYRDETHLGSGGLKDVYKAFDEAARQWVALARLRKDRGLRCYDLFVHEAWLIASLSHPNIIKVHDVGVDEGGRPFFTMDLKRGTSLNDLIRSNPPQIELLEIFLKICDAVAYAHSKGIIHLDLKPENIQCDRFGEVLVCDWGSACSLQKEKEEGVDSSLSRELGEQERKTGDLRGTPGYMAPEQITAQDGCHDERADVYALGCILHCILSGEPPFKGSLKEVLDQTKNSEVTSLRSRFPDRVISKSMEAVVLKALALSPSRRYTSVIELKQEVHKFLSGFSTTAESPGLLRKCRLFVRRHRNSARVTLAALVVLSLSSVLFMQRLVHQQTVTEEEQVRANQLMSEVSLLSTEYDALFEESTGTKKELAEKLVRSADRALNSSFFERPTRTVTDTIRLLDMALELDPESESAKWQRYYIHGLQMNHQEALKMELPDEQHLLPEISGIVEAYPNFNYGRENRPSPEGLKGFFKEAILHNDESRISGYLERVFTYHHMIESSYQSLLAEELSALVACFNGGSGQTEMRYIPETHKVVLKSDADKFVLASRNGGSGHCILRFLPVRHLELHVDGNFNLKHLKFLDVETVDLSYGANFKLNSRLNLPHLKKIIIRSGELSPELLREHIRSIDYFEIVEI